MKFALATSVALAAANSIELGPYPGYTGDLKVSGEVSAYYSERSEKVYMYYRLNGVEADLCKTPPEGVANACGIHIHEGQTCDDADKVGGHYFSVDSDPWGAIVYTAERDGRASGKSEVSVGGKLDIHGRAMVVHDHTGGRVACGLLPAGFFESSRTVNFGPYPGYTGDLKVTGDVAAYYSGRNEDVYMFYNIAGTEADKCKTPPEGVANACGIHIHEGQTCDDADKVGGHYYSVDSDPWGAITYNADRRGRAFGTKTVDVGGELDISGRAMVVHDSTGARVACALLPASMFQSQSGVKFGTYPGYTGDLKVRGDVSAYYSARNEEVYMRYYIEGTEAEKCKTPPEGVANACGIHIHEGQTCDDADKVGGHYYSVDSDPWGVIVYKAESSGRAYGTAKVAVGADLDISGRAMVVHDSTGGRVACAQLPAEMFKPLGSVKFSTYPGYTGELKVTGEVSAYYSEKDQDVFMRYSISGTERKECATPPEGVANACGIHIHEGKTCDDADQVGGHYFSVDSDPWGVITYSSDRHGHAYGKNTVSVGEGLDISGRAMVVHDSTGGRVACALLPADFFTV